MHGAAPYADKGVYKQKSTEEHKAPSGAPRPKTESKGYQPPRDEQEGLRSVSSFGVRVCLC